MVSYARMPLSSIEAEDAAASAAAESVQADILANPLNQAQLPGMNTQSDSTNAAAAVAQDAMRKATVVKQLNQAQLPGMNTQSDSTNAAAAVAQDAMRKATVVKQVRQAVIQEQLQQAAAKAQAQLQLQAQLQQTVLLPGGMLQLQQAAAKAQAQLQLQAQLQQTVLLPGGMLQLQQAAAKAQAQLQLQAQLQQTVLLPGGMLVRPNLLNPPVFMQPTMQQQLLAAQLQMQSAAALPQLGLAGGVGGLSALTGTPLVTACTTAMGINPVFYDPSAAVGSLLTSQPEMDTSPMMSTSAEVSQGIAVQRTVQTPVGELPVYPTPDVTQYQYEETSGFYYDPTTGLYYDGNTQYYYNAETQKYLYWDAHYSTYMPAPDSGSAETDADKPKKEKEEKVKVAKKIQKDMERWAKQQNKSKTSVAGPPPEQAIAAPSSAPVKSATNDVAFSILESQSSHFGPSRPKLVAYEEKDSKEEHIPDPPSPPPPPSRSGLPDPHDDPVLTDWDKKACLLCKRQFPTGEALMRHQKMSDLHKSNLAVHLAQASAPGNLPYRDRAKERREKYGPDSETPPNRLKEKYQADRPSYEQPTVHGIGSDNIGNKLLKNMGWSEGKGLGRANQGIVNPIQAQRHVQGAGLGAGATLPSAPGDYADNVKAVMRQKFYQQ